MPPRGTPRAEQVGLCGARIALAGTFGAELDTRVARAPPDSTEGHRNHSRRTRTRYEDRRRPPGELAQEISNGSAIPGLEDKRLRLDGQRQRGVPQVGAIHLIRRLLNLVTRRSLLLRVAVLTTSSSSW